MNAMDAVNTPAARLVARGLSLGYGTTRGADALVNRDVNLAIPDRQVTTIIGANGCGKSTLLRGLARLMAPAAGAVTLDGVDIAGLPAKRLATKVSMLPQSPIAPAGVSVRELVSRGRHPHQSWLRQWSASHSAAVDRALALTGLSELADRPVDTLSGGQRQRAWISLVLAQDTDIVFLDEPTTYLDLAYSVEVLELVRRLNREQDKTVVMVLHDLNLAARYSDNLVLMREGAIVAQGPPADVISEHTLREVFGLHARVVDDPVTGGPLIVPEAGVRV
ncbi:ABC transporter ATP-binding protein [Corynebacterium vitaeruminis]|uniref:Iron ABC transporter ATP-binding protein n=1 Tax=Corynebacterium vitaeruminis DSM 20294 TaxID=1224164 RepID=W5XZK7_9CORY|nr:ABC transporter ATP-binding protein [Corynebacterium vitaeruminis]AHI22144.1 iron ABC transporter ATP-binding protein [Corynebacterium vitaeruminis DSM 20294]